MREILFRGKSTDINKWVYGFYAGENCEYPWSPTIKQANIIQQGSGLWYEVAPKTVGQYTGLTDKNGVKIFEGDIIQTDDPDEEPAKVFYDEEETEFAVIIDNCYYGLGSNFNETDLTVIGNIHDNPEQLWDGDSE